MAEDSDEVVRAIQLSVLTKSFLDGLRHGELVLASQMGDSQKNSPSVVDICGSSGRVPGWPSTSHQR